MRKLLFLTGVILTGVAGLAQVSPFDLGLGVRALGLGGAYAALAEGPEGVLANPAGLAQVRSLSADSSFANILGLYSMGWIGGAMPNLAAGLVYLSTTVTGPEDEALGFSQFGLIAGFGMDLGQMFPFPVLAGVGVRYQNTSIAGEGSSGFALDLGIIGQFTLALGELRGALAIRELGVGEWSTEFVFAGAWISGFGLFASLDITSEYTALGVGWSLLEMAEVRAGLRLEGEISRWAFGLGARWGMFFLDYALLTHPMLDLSHRFGLGVEF